jgi:hypothetical protein
MIAAVAAMLASTQLAAVTLAAWWRPEVPRAPSPVVTSAAKETPACIDTSMRLLAETNLRGRRIFSPASTE